MVRQHSCPKKQNLGKTLKEWIKIIKKWIKILKELTQLNQIRHEHFKLNLSSQNIRKVAISLQTEDFIQRSLHVLLY